MVVRRLPFHRAGVATRQFAPLVASLTGGAFTPTAAFFRTDDPRVAMVAPQLGWDTCAPTHAFPSVFPHPFSPTLESRRVTTSDRFVDARSTTTVSKPVHPSGDGIPIPSPPSIKTGGLPVCTGLRRAAPRPVHRGHHPPPCGSRGW